MLPILKKFVNFFSVIIDAFAKTFNMIGKMGESLADRVEAATGEKLGFGVTEDEKGQRNFFSDLLAKFKVGKGEFDEIVSWLNENIHEKGKLLSIEELSVKITGEPLNFKHFMRYSKKKYVDIYNINT